MNVKLLLYCTKAKPYLIYDYYDNSCGKSITADKIESWHLNGKIVAECECDKVEKFDVPYPAYFWEVKDKLEHITRCSCLSLMNLHHYLGNENGYALHLSNVKVFDEPKKLSEYSIFEPENYIFRDIKKAPQNMCRVVKEPETMWYAPKEDYILISIQPQHLVKILNGKKTIEVRKKILNSLKEVLENV